MVSLSVGKQIRERKKERKSYTTYIHVHSYRSEEWWKKTMLQTHNEESTDENKWMSEYEKKRLKKGMSMSGNSKR